MWNKPRCNTLNSRKNPSYYNKINQNIYSWWHLVNKMRFIYCVSVYGSAVVLRQGRLHQHKSASGRSGLRSAHGWGGRACWRSLTLSLRPARGGHERQSVGLRALPRGPCTGGATDVDQGRDHVKSRLQARDADRPPSSVTAGWMGMISSEVQIVEVNAAHQLGATARPALARVWVVWLHSPECAADLPVSWTGGPHAGEPRPAARLRASASRCR